MDKQNEENKSKVQFPPVVAVLGHVDHGKTTLLDAVRKTSIAQREHGGITQGIGASSVEIEYEGKKRRITFIDTPGHEAFSKMRSRGAQAANIGLLIISSVEGIMPQTRESIQVLKAANMPFIVVLTMSDLPTKNPEKVKQQLLREDILLEEFAGDVPILEVSAKTGQNIKELLDLILLVAELHPPQPVPTAQGVLQAIVIEAKLDQRTGAKATVIVKNGTLQPRDFLACEGLIFRVRGIVNDKGEQVATATVGYGVELLGTEVVLPVGSIVTTKSDAMQMGSGEPEKLKNQQFSYHKRADGGRLALILCADNQGSLEAILQALPEKVDIAAKKTGEITEADVLQAKAIGAVILSFNIKIRPDVQKLAMTEKVLIRNYKIIYEMLDEIKDVLEGKRLALIEQIYGHAKVLAKFPFEKSFAYGISVVDGRVARGDKIRVMRGEAVIGETTLQSLRVGKNVVSKVEKGHEAGFIPSQQLDITIGDMILSIG